MSELAPSYASTRLTIDIYCLQHPDDYCVSAKSLAAHLTGLCWALEHGGDEWGLRALQRWLNTARLDKPPIPEHRGELTIADVSSASDYLGAQNRWARSTWAAYADLHDLARGWILTATRIVGGRGDDRGIRR